MNGPNTLVFHRFSFNEGSGGWDRTWPRDGLIAEAVVSLPEVLSRAFEPETPGEDLGRVSSD